MYTLRDYQQEAVGATYAAIKDGCKNPLVVLPTGGGKSLVIAKIVQDCEKRGKRVLMVTHVKELIEQNHEKIKLLCPDADIGIFSAGMRKKQKHNQVICAGIQSLAKHIYSAGAFDIIICDEADKIPSRDTTQYQQLIQACRLMNPNAILLGLTATPYRLDNGYIYGTDDSIFDKVVYELPITTLLNRGYLTPIISKGSLKKIDTTNIGTKFGDFIEKELQKVCSDEELIDSVVDEILEYGKTRKAWLVFATGVENAHKIKDKIIERGMTSVDVVTGSTNKKEREVIIERFKKGELRCLINVSALLIGFDAPICDMLALVRATGSTALLAQCVGRIYRLHKQLDKLIAENDLSGKILVARYEFEIDKIKEQLDAKGIEYKDVVFGVDGDFNNVMANKETSLFLDYGENIMRHGLLDDLHPPEKKLKKGDAERMPVKECPKCHEMLAISVKECACGHLFTFNDNSTHSDRAYDGAIMSSDVKSVTSKVYNLAMQRHRKKGVSMVKCTFMLDNFDNVVTYICIEHDGYAKKKAQETLDKLGLGACKTVTDVLFSSHLITKPKSITYKPAFGSGKYPEIKSINV